MPKSEEKQKDKFYTIQFIKQDMALLDISGYIISTSSKDKAIEIAKKYSKSTDYQPQIKESSVHIAHAYDIAISDMVPDPPKSEYTVIGSIDGEWPVDDIKHHSLWEDIAEHTAFGDLT